MRSRRLVALLLAGAALGPLVGCGDDEGSRPSVVDPRLTDDVPAVVRGDCALAAKKMSGGAVYCPPLVPRGSTTSQNRSSRGRVSIPADGDEYALNFVTAGLAGFDPAQPQGFREHLGHWLIASYDSSRGLDSGPGARIVRRLRVGGIPVTVVERRAVAYDLDAGHVLAFWPFEGRTYEVSLHGFENRVPVLEMARATIAQMEGCADLGGEAEAGCDLVFVGGH